VPEVSEHKADPIQEPPKVNPPNDQVDDSPPPVKQAANAGVQNSNQPANQPAKIPVSKPPILPPDKPEEVDEDKKPLEADDNKPVPLQKLLNRLEELRIKEERSRGKVSLFQAAEAQRATAEEVKSWDSKLVSLSGRVVSVEKRGVKVEKKGEENKELGVSIVTPFGYTTWVFTKDPKDPLPIHLIKGDRVEVVGKLDRRTWTYWEIRDGEIKLKPKGKPPVPAEEKKVGDQENDLDKPLNLAVIFRQEILRGKAMDEVRGSGNQVLEKKLRDAQAKERESFVGKAVEGVAVVYQVKVITLAPTAGEKPVQVVMGFPQLSILLVVTAQAADPDDPILGKLTKGQELKVKGTITALAGDFRLGNCKFTEVKSK
jgi:hypothetical protein